MPFNRYQMNGTLGQYTSPIVRPKIPHKPDMWARIEWTNRWNYVSGGRTSALVPQNYYTAIALVDTAYPFPNKEFRFFSLREMSAELSEALAVGRRLSESDIRTTVTLLIAKNLPSIVLGLQNHYERLARNEAKRMKTLNYVIGTIGVIASIATGGILAPAAISIVTALTARTVSHYEAKEFAKDMEKVAEQFKADSPAFAAEISRVADMFDAQAARAEVLEAKKKEFAAMTPEERAALTAVPDAYTATFKDFHVQGKFELYDWKAKASKRFTSPEEVVESMSSDRSPWAPGRVQIVFQGKPIMTLIHQNLFLNVRFRAAGRPLAFITRKTRKTWIVPKEKEAEILAMSRDEIVRAIADEKVDELLEIVPEVVEVVQAAETQRVEEVQATQNQVDQAADQVLQDVSDSIQQVEDSSVEGRQAGHEEFMRVEAAVNQVKDNIMASETERIEQKIIEEGPEEKSPWWILIPIAGAILS